MSRENRQVGEAETFARYADGRINIATACMSGHIVNLDLAEALVMERRALECQVTRAASDLEQVSRERDEAVRMLRGAGVCAYDLDERTVTLALDTEEQVLALTAALPAKHRAFLNNLDNRNE